MNVAEALGRYLEIRDFFTGWLAQRQADGVGGPDAAANAPLRKLFTALVDALARQNTMFQSYMYDTVVSRDPLLLRDE